MSDSVTKITLPNVNDFSNFISLGYFCDVAEAIQRIGLRKQSYPFDWIISNDLNSLLLLIKNCFKDFLNYDVLLQSKTKKSIYKNAKYNVIFYHDFDEYLSLEKQLPKIQEKYKRRIDRFYNSIRQPTLFIRYIADEEEARYISVNYFELSKTLKGYNKQNEIIFLCNSDINTPSTLDNILFKLNPDKGDIVCRNIIDGNSRLREYLFSIDKSKIDKTSIEKYKQIQRNKYPSLIVCFKRKAKKLVKRIFYRQYNHINKF